ncbi:MAG: hypothetical protein GY862_20850 [Gammaproteobacteria bacterium]|nr:hypothetical protein [Gammaproteobacteria bacterium]
MCNCIIKPLFLFLCFVNTAFAFDNITFELRPESGTEILPLQSVVMTAGMANRGEGPIMAPVLKDNMYLTFSLLREGAEPRKEWYYFYFNRPALMKELALEKSKTNPDKEKISILTNKEILSNPAFINPMPPVRDETFGANPDFQVLQPGEERVIRINIALNWPSREREGAKFCFPEPRVYKLWATVRSKDLITHVLSANPVTITVKQPDENRQKQIDELLATDAFQYTYFPSGFSKFVRDMKTAAEKLLAFYQKYPDSPYRTDLLYLIADWHGEKFYLAKETVDENAYQMYRKLITDYLQQPQATYRHQAELELRYTEARYRRRKGIE